MRALGVYVDDTIRWNRLTLNAGLRYDSSKGYFNSFPILDRNANEIGTSPAVDKLFDWSVISPRLGATVKLNEAGTTLIKGSWGRYYRGIVTGEFDPATPSIADKFEFSGTYDAQGNPQDLSLVTSNDNLRIDSGFENPYTDQYIVTFEHQLSDRIGFAVNGVWKKWDNQSAWRDIGGTYAPGDPHRRRADVQPVAADQRRREPYHSTFERRRDGSHLQGRPLPGQQAHVQPVAGHGGSHPVEGRRTARDEHRARLANFEWQ